MKAVEQREPAPTVDHNNSTSHVGLTGLAKLVIALTIVLISVGAIWHGDTLKSWSHLMRDLSDRPSGPLSFRFILQPAMAMIAAFHDGVQDARTGRSPYFWTVLTNPRERIARLNEGLVSTARIFLLGIVMDTVYQLKVFKTFYPFEAVLIAILLAFVPYLLLRGPIARIARRRLARKPADSAA